MRGGGKKMATQAIFPYPTDGQVVDLGPKVASLW